MKKLIVSLLFSATFFFTFSQSLVITGDTLFFGDPNIQMSNHFNVRNITNDSITVNCRKNEISIPVGSEAIFCWAGNCYGSTTLVSSSSAIIPPNQTLFHPNIDAHTGYYDAFGNSGIAIVEYCFYDVNNITDESCLTVRYETSSMSLIDFNNSIGEFFPNPANQSINFTSNLEGHLEIVDVLGNLVRKIDLSKRGTKEINVSELNNGVYFGKFFEAKNLVEIKKLVIKR